ncbi:MAG TPA: sensor domain-containing diguanylate cyclase, partial [Candidatus Angelobacter sp.]|nr:sensor domain-containing diguanylate cyclase [Candidatus Angelobacter sp.]
MQDTLLDILILGLLVLLFALVYRTRRALRLRYWIAGWFFILAHFALMLANPASTLWQNVAVALTLATLLLGGVCFLMASARASSSSGPGRCSQGLLAVPLVAYIFLAVFTARPVPLVAGFLLVEAAVYFFVFHCWPHRPRVLAASILCGGAALVWMGFDITRHQEIPGVYALLMQIYLTNAIVYWHGFHRWSAGVITAASGLVVWGLVFPIAVTLAALAPHLHVSGELWNLPKYFVEFGMILTLVEDEVIQTARQREEYRVLFDGNPHPMWIFDPETLEFLKINSAAMNHYGYKQEEFLAKSLRGIHQEEDLPRLEHRLKDAGEHTLYSGPWTHVRKDGSTIQVEVASHRIQFEGRPARFALVQDVTERQQLYERLVYQANHDMLTGLPNRLLLKDRMQQLLATSERQVHQAAILCLYLVRFKQVNDTYGHYAGDICLQQIAKTLRERLRMTDTIARSGGEEFIILLGQLKSPADAGHVARELLDSFRQSLL